MKNVSSNLFAGLTTGALVIIFSITLPALIFTGEYASYLSLGIGMALASNAVLNFIIAWRSTFPAVVSSPQDKPAVVLAIMAASIAGQITATGQPSQLLPTLLVAMTLTSVITGVFVLLMGYLRFGALIRFIPYPVIGGFLAGTGWLLLTGSIGVVMTGTEVTLMSLPSLIQPDLLVRWLPGLALALVLRGVDNLKVIPLILTAAIGLFYSVLWLTEMPIDVAMRKGLFLGPFSGGASWQPLTPSLLVNVNWEVLQAQAGNMAAVMVVSVIAILLNTTGIEIQTERDMDLDREFRVTGIANIAAAAAGGSLVGYHTPAASLLGMRLGGTGRMVGLIIAVMSVVVLIFGTQVLSYCPRLVLGGLLLWVAIDFLDEWLYQTYFKLPRMEYALIILILVVIGFWGFLPGVGLGFVIAVVIFVVSYSRIRVVKLAFSGNTYRSRAERSLLQEKFLMRFGEQIYILRLQGYLFFGTANELLEEVRGRFQDPERPTLKYLILDFHAVAGLDSSALLSFVKMKQQAEQNDICLVFTNLSEQMRTQLERSGISDRHARTVFVSELDRGVEWCEDRILDREGVLKPPGLRLIDQLADMMPSHMHRHLPALMHYLERIALASGHVLFRQGERADSLYFIESGQLSAQLELEDGTSKRLLTMAAGRLVGEVAMYLDLNRSATVVAEKSSVLYRLSAADMHKMESENPALAGTLHRFVASLLAERLVSLNRMVDILMR